MAKSPPKKPRDPAKPTRAKAARPDDKPTPDALADLLNPGIGRGTAGIGSGTGTPSFRGAGEAREPGIQKQVPSQHLDSGSGPSGRPGMTEKSGLQQPPDNSWDRRRDFSEAHKARKSTPKEFNEAPQRDYSASPITGLDPQLEKEFGLGDDADFSSPSPAGGGSSAEARQSEGGRGGVAGAKKDSHPPAGFPPATSPLQGEVEERNGQS